MKVIYSAITKSEYKIRSLFAFEQTDLNLPNLSCLPQLSQGLYAYHNYVATAETFLNTFLYKEIISGDSLS